VRSRRGYGRNLRTFAGGAGFSTAADSRRPDVAIKSDHRTPVKCRSAMKAIAQPYWTRGFGDANVQMSRRRLTRRIELEA
jgi:hypothetical protein